MIALLKVATIGQLARLNCILYKNTALSLLPEMWVSVREVVKTAWTYRILLFLVTRIHLSAFSYQA